MSYPPLYNFDPLGPGRVACVRHLREAMWVRLHADAQPKPRKPRASAGKPRKTKATVFLCPPALLALPQAQREAILALLNKA